MSQGEGGGRPTKYTPELADIICEGIAAGVSLHRICTTSDDLPAPRTIYNWLRTEPTFLQNYEHAKEDQADKMVEEMIEIADDGTNDYMDKIDVEGGKVGRQANTEHIQRSRLRLDTRRWVASKFKNKKYGEKITQNHEGSIGLTDLSSDELDRKIQQLESLSEQSSED